MKLRILQSSKYQSAMLATALGIVGIVFVALNKSMDLAGKQDQIQTIVKGIFAAWFAAIGATGLEDALSKHGQNSAYLSPPITPVASAPPVASVPPPNPQPRLNVIRSAKIVVVLIAALTLAFVTTGCASGVNPQLDTFRAGTESIVNPLCDAHLKLMDEAVVAGIRNDAHRQIVQAGVAEWKSLDAQSKATQAAAAIAGPSPPK